METYCRICGYQAKSFKPLDKNFKNVLGWMYPHLDFKSGALQICQDECPKNLSKYHKKAYSRSGDGRRPTSYISIAIWDSVKDCPKFDSFGTPYRMSNGPRKKLNGQYRNPKDPIPSHEILDPSFDPKDTTVELSLTPNEQSVAPKDICDPMISTQNRPLEEKEIEIKDEPILIQDGDTKVKEEFDIYEENFDSPRKSHQGINFDEACSQDVICHLRKHTEKNPYQGSHCESDLSADSTIINHLRAHSGDTTFQCSNCHSTFSHKITLLKHMKTHNGEKAYQCSHCESSFSQKLYLIRHLRTHTGEKPYQCNHCNKVFSLSSNLIRHRKTHTGEKPYQCSHCDKAFSQKSNLMKHMQIHMWEKSYDSYQCSQCDKVFSEKSQIIQHQWIHTGDKPFQCSHCEKCFAKKCNLVNHLRTHTRYKNISLQPL